MGIRKLSTAELGVRLPETMQNLPRVEVVFILEDIRSMHNIGSIFRSADAFGVQSLYLTGITARPPHRDIQKTALGATETVKWSYHESIVETIESLKKSGYQILALEQVENPLWLGEWNPDDAGKYAIILGNEVTGVSQEALDFCENAIEIPQSGNKHSLNVAVAAGIVMQFFHGK